MTAAGIIVGGVALVYLVMLDVHLTRRCDALSEDLDIANKRLDNAVVRVSHVEDAIPAAVSPVEPFTRPIRIPVTPSGARSDTAEQGAVIEEQHRELVRREFGGVVFAFRAEGEG